MRTTSVGRRAMRALLILLVLCLGSAHTTWAAEWVRRKTDTNWTWFEDYAFRWATYLVACEPGRQCQVGMGIFAFGEPRGEKISFSGQTEVLVIGFGALHIRPSDGNGPVKAAIALKEEGLFQVNWDF